MHKKICTSFAIRYWFLNQYNDKERLLWNKLRQIACPYYFRCALFWELSHEHGPGCRLNHKLCSRPTALLCAAIYFLCTFFQKVEELIMLDWYLQPIQNANQKQTKISQSWSTFQSQTDLVRAHCNVISIILEMLGYGFCPHWNLLARGVHNFWAEDEILSFFRTIKRVTRNPQPSAER